ncbi:transposase family protein [Leptothermofonsia sp. ETS-13]
MGVETLTEQLKSIPDWRRGRKVQYPLWLMLLMSLLDVMSGYSSL